MSKSLCLVEIVKVGTTWQEQFHNLEDWELVLTHPQSWKGGLWARRRSGVTWSHSWIPQRHCSDESCSCGAYVSWDEHKCHPGKHSHNTTGSAFSLVLNAKSIQYCGYRSLISRFLSSPGRRLVMRSGYPLILPQKCHYSHHDINIQFF